MGVIFGSIFVLVAVIVGFSMAGGKVTALIHLSELITIGGASLGAMIIMSPKKVLIDLLRGVVQIVKGSPYNKQVVVELFSLFTALTKMIRRDGLLSLDAHLTNPHESAVFQRFPRLSGNHHIQQFLTRALNLVMEGNTDAAQITEALEAEVKVIEREHSAAVAVMAKTADAMPGFGIVAAVLGIVVTMSSIDGPASEIGHKVGAALVGTFLGILLSYGFLAPMAARMEHLGEVEGVFLRAISAGVVAMGGGSNPRDVLSRMVRVVGTETRPSEQELNQIIEVSSP